jgi:hypothetical protein
MKADDALGSVAKLLQQDIRQFALDRKLPIWGKKYSYHSAWGGPG